MRPRWRLWLAGSLFVAVLVAAMYFPGLRRRMREAARLQQKSEEQARQELTAPLVGNSGEPRVKAKLFWAANLDDGTLAPVTIELPLSSEPVLRAKQVLNTLLAGPVDSELRTLPPDVALLAFYVLPDGTAIADFSEALATSLPSGIQSEQLAVDSLTRTLEANVPQIRQLKILIHGQEVDTLAGHVDLTGMFPVNTKAPVKAVSPVVPATTSPQSGKLTPGAAPGKLAQPQSKR